MLIKQAIEEEIPDIRIDREFYKRIIKIEIEFVNKNPEHIEFFGGTLLGVQVVRFTPEDRDKIFEHLLKIDESILEDTLYNLKFSNNSFVINKEWRVSSDVFNIGIIWLIYQINKSRYLSDQEKKEAKIRLCMYMLYRFFTSLLFNYFRYPADKNIAKTTYDSLSYKYIIKQQGSWWQTFRYLAENAVSDKGIHGKFLNSIDDDGYFVTILNDVQGRVRDMFKNIYSVHIKIKESGNKFNSSSSLIETDGEMVLKDKHKSLENYTRYIKTVVPDRNSFIKEELVDIVADIMHTMPQKLLMESLEWCSSNYGHLSDNLIERTIDAIMENAFDYLSEHRTLLHNKNNLQDLITKLRGTYMSSRSNDELVVKARELSTKIITSSVKTKNESVIAALKTGFMIYVVLRALTMKHYSS